ncbi:MAG: ferredoxin [Candidatus Berkelbacteria bacterium]|nr:ferredoxin [Candidatus Berkelbacteria bacterium]
MVKADEIKVNNKKCIGCGNCILECPELFHFDKKGKSEVVDGGECESCSAQEIIDICPQDAIAKV